MDKVSTDTMLLLLVRNLVNAGYPMEKDSISFVDWVALGIIEQSLQNKIFFRRDK